MKEEITIPQIIKKIRERNWVNGITTREECAFTTSSEAWMEICFYPSEENKTHTSILSDKVELCIWSQYRKDEYDMFPTSLDDHNVYVGTRRGQIRANVQGVGQGHIPNLSSRRYEDRLQRTSLEIDVYDGKIIIFFPKDATIYVEKR